MAESCEKYFQLLNDRLTFALIFALPEGIKGFFVYCDASQVSLGCKLRQHLKVYSMTLGNSSLMGRIIKLMTFTLRLWYLH